MQIHSSSLAFVPSGHSANNRTNQSQLSNKTQEKQLESSVSSSPDTQKVDKKNDAPTLQLISDSIEQQRKVPSNSRTARAIGAYTQESTQSLKNQRSELVSGIDLFA